MSNNAYERQLYVGPFIGTDGTRSSGRAGKTGEQVVSVAHAPHYESSGRSRIFMARAVVTAPVIWSTEAGTGGPLLWNSSSSVVANVLAVSVAITTASAVAGALGYTWGVEQTSAPTSTTVIDSSGCARIDGSTPAVNVYRVGTTVENLGFMPIAEVGTGAITVGTVVPKWIDLRGLVTIPQNSFWSIAASATLTTGVFQIGVIWEEVPVA